MTKLSMCTFEHNPFLKCEVIHGIVYNASKILRFSENCTLVRQKNWLLLKKKNGYILCGIYLAKAKTIKLISQS